MFIKIGEALDILKVEDVQSCIPAVSEEVLDNFRKFAANLKKVAPKAENFLYFSAVMMHAAEAASLNDDGSIKLTSSGEPVKVGWDEGNNGSLRWKSNDPSIKPYKNANCDIFPEKELIKAYKKWIGKPLCIDHKSSSVDHVRGFIVDTYYDRDLKRVIALCALDKENYPDLARKVATGYSSSVSMGTAVGRAICSDCGRVARVESEFCDHMRNKTCYGEINVDLNPIELSIVVNGADPKAHIKHIIAAAKNLNDYVEKKEKEISKIADNFSASFNVNTKDGESSSINIQAPTLEKLQQDVSNAMVELAQLAESLNKSEKDTNDSAFNQSSGSVSMDETDLPNTDSGLAPPHVRYASTNVEANLVSELRAVMSSVETKLSQMKTSLDEIEKTSTNLTAARCPANRDQEENMSGSNNIKKESYFQGAPGDEPTPGKPKYPVDPTNENLRTKGDKHMDADDTGPTTGLFPGDLEQKKMLARAEAEQRALKRQGLVDAAKNALEQSKRAYFQQGDKNPEEPTPGKPKYPVDPTNQQLREKEDKQMVGAKPFPEVGPVDGMYPGDKEVKEKLSRASLKARFVKSANEDGTQNLGGSHWDVYLGDKLLLTASVNELSGGRAGFFYDSIATKQYGGKLIEKVKVLGAAKVKELVKSAQTPEVPEAPVTPPAPEAPAEEVATPEDTGKSGNPEETAVELAEKVRDLSSDLVEVVRSLTGEQAEMGEIEPTEPEMGAVASETNTLNTLRTELNGALTHAIKESIAELNEHQQELEMIAGMYAKGGVNNSNKEFVGTITEDAFTEAKTSIADGTKLMTAFIKYARGTQAIVKRAEIEAELNALSEGDDDMAYVNDAGDESAVNSLINETNDELAAVESLLGDDETEVIELDEPLPAEALADNNALDVVVEDPNEVGEVAREMQGMPDATVNVAASYNSKQARAALRAKLAADTLATSSMPREAHPGGGVTTQLDVKPEGDLAKVEVLEETQKAMLDLAKAPPKVRKEAEAIHMLVSQGRLEPTDENFAALITEGLDKDAVAYYKKYWGQVDKGSEFASELVKEHVKAEMEQELETYKIKLARAYELTYDMVSRGLCHNDTSAISSQVDEIMKFNDDSFDSLKKVVAKHNPKMHKEAGFMPQVGIIGSGDVSSAPDDSENLVSVLSSALSKTTKRMF